MVTQSCLTPCDPVDCSLPGSSVHGDSPDKNTGVGCRSFSISNGSSSSSNYDPYYSTKKTYGATPRKCLRKSVPHVYVPDHLGPRWRHRQDWVGVSRRQDMMGRSRGILEGSLEGVPSAQHLHSHSSQSLQQTREGPTIAPSPRIHRLGVAALIPNPCNPGVTHGQQHPHQCRL